MAWLWIPSSFSPHRSFVPSNTFWRHYYQTCHFRADEEVEAGYLCGAAGEEEVDEGLAAVAVDWVCRMRDCKMRDFKMKVRKMTVR